MKVQYCKVQVLSIIRDYIKVKISQVYRCFMFLLDHNSIQNVGLMFLCSSAPLSRTSACTTGLSGESSGGTGGLTTRTARTCAPVGQPRRAELWMSGIVKQESALLLSIILSMVLNHNHGSFASGRWRRSCWVIGRIQSKIWGIFCGLS